MEFFRIEKSNIASDGNHIEIAFETDTGSAAVGFNSSALNGIAGELGRLLLEARKIRGEGSMLVPAIEPEGYRAKPTKDHRFVVVGLKMPNGLEENFAFAVGDAEVLQAQIREAIDKCRSA